MSYYSLGDTFKWFMARVVDIEDPEFLGRVKIRVIHDQTGELGKKQGNFGLTDDDLLWAWPISSIQSASLSWKKINELEYDNGDFVPDWIDAVGLSPTGIAVGTYCFGFYLDGQEANIPMIFGTYHKVSMYPEPGSDPQTMLQDLPDPPNPNYRFYDVGSLAKGFYVDETRGISWPGQTLPKEPYFYSELWNDDPKSVAAVDEMPTAYNTTYPYNTTYTTKSGHAIEIDDTKGHERIHIWHQSGCYEEISNGPSNPAVDDDPIKDWPLNGPGGWDYVSAGKEKETSWKGRRVRRTMDHHFDIVGKDYNQLIKRDHNVSISNTETIMVGNTAHWMIGWKQPPENRVNDNGKTKYTSGGIDERNYFFDIANNSIQTIGNNSIISIGYDPKDERRLETDYFDEFNHYIDVANNSTYTSANNHQWSIGYNKETERKYLEEDNNNHYFDVANNTVITTENNYALSVGYHYNDERGVSANDSTNMYIDVKNNSRTTIENNYYLGVGLIKDNERKAADDDFGNFYADISGNEVHHVGRDIVFKGKMNEGHDINGSLYSNAGSQVHRAVNGFVIISDNNGITLDGGDAGVGVYGPLTVWDSKLKQKKTAAVSGSFVSVDWKTITVVNGIITDIS